MHRNNIRSLQDYFTLLQALVAVDTAQEDPTAPAAHASMVELVRLSSNCSKVESLREIPIIRKCVLACCEVFLSSLIERASFFQDPASGATDEITTTIPTRQAPL
jgi:hypothetical protein